MLLVMGGWNDKSYKALCAVWLLDLKTWRWSEVRWKIQTEKLVY